MNDLDKKLQVLSKVAHVLNERKVIWAIGASMLLYFKNKTNYFHDIDIMLVEDDVEKLKDGLLTMGELAPPNPDKQYKTRHFLEFTIEGVEVDVMAGFVIVKDDMEYDCSLTPDQIVEHIQINGEEIPLQSIENWRRYYELMGRTRKVEMIDSELLGV